MNLHPSWRFLVVALAVMVVALGAGVGSRLATQERSTPPPMVLALDSSQVRRVVVKSDIGKVELVRGTEGRWSSGAGSPPQAATLLTDAETRLFPLRAYRDVRAAANLAEYGLARPEIVFTVEDATGGLHRVLLGAPTFTTAGVYARRGNDSGRLFLVARGMMDDLRSLVAGERVHVENELPRKIRELESEQREAAASEVSWWLRQVLDNAGAAAEEQP